MNLDDLLALPPVATPAPAPKPDATVVGADPLAEMMRARGFDPDRGAILVIPEAHRDKLPPVLPRYVRLNPYVTVAVMLH